MRDVPQPAFALLTRAAIFFVVALKPGAGNYATIRSFCGESETAIDAVLVGEEDAAFNGGSYVVVQKYLHDLDGWNALCVELDESVKPTSAHNALTAIVEARA